MAQQDFLNFSNTVPDIGSGVGNVDAIGRYGKFGNFSPSPINLNDDILGTANKYDNFLSNPAGVTGTGVLNAEGILGPSAGFDPLNPIPTDMGSSGGIFGDLFSDSDLEIGKLGLDLATSIGQYGLLSDQLDLGREQLATNKAFGNRNLANTAQTVNAAIEAQQADLIHNANTAAPGDNRAPLRTVDQQLARYGVDGSAI